MDELMTIFKQNPTAAVFVLGLLVSGFKLWDFWAEHSDKTRDRNKKLFDTMFQAALNNGAGTLIESRIRNVIREHELVEKDGIREALESAKGDAKCHAQSIELKLDHLDIRLRNVEIDMAKSGRKST